MGKQGRPMGYTSPLRSWLRSELPWVIVVLAVGVVVAVVTTRA